jgi:hypothetical protein
VLGASPSGGRERSLPPPRNDESSCKPKIHDHAYRCVVATSTKLKEVSWRTLRELSVIGVVSATTSTLLMEVSWGTLRTHSVIGRTCCNKRK